jgi:hypothetical protein
MKYGIGQEILYKTQLQELTDQGKVTDSPELRDYITSPSDDEIADGLVSVKLKNFEDIRKLAEACDLKDLYVLYYQPFSIDAHGHWPALRKNYLIKCEEPLHRFHFRPTFRLPGLDFSLIEIALELFLQAYHLWAEHYKLRSELETVVENFIACVDASFAKATAPQQS